MRRPRPLWETLILVAIVVTMLVGAAVVVHETFQYADWWGSAVLVGLVPIMLLATRKAVRLLNGTDSHTQLSTTSDWWMSEDGGRAFVPSACFAVDGLVVGYGALLFDGGKGPVTPAIALVGSLVFVGFSLAGLSAGWFRRPRWLVPATMRPR